MWCVLVRGRERRAIVATQDDVSTQHDEREKEKKWWW